MKSGRFTLHFRHAGSDRYHRTNPTCVLCGQAIRFITAKQGRKYHHIRCLFGTRKESS